MKKTSILYIYLVLCIVLLSSCKQSAYFTVTGVVTGANSQLIYLENVGLLANTVIDSVKINASGRFTFKKKSPEYPDFYRLKLNNQYINFAIDSTEMIEIMADYKSFATSYQVLGSETCTAIKEITLAQLDVNQAIHRARKDFEAHIITDTIYRSISLNAIENYKEIARKYIYDKPKSPESYFALFQQIDGLLMFDPYDKNDSRAYGAVATSYNYWYPQSPRSKHLYNLTLQALKVIRGQRSINLENVDTKEVDYVDIELPNIRGEKIKLSDVAEDKVVILNFTLYQSEWSPELNQILERMDSTFHDKGLEIYQISLDTDVHLWKNTASTFRWICVRDPQTVYSQTAATYNVKQLPSLFLLGRNGLLIKRIEKIETLLQDINSLL